MWLNYGISDERGLVHISDTPRGRSQLHCPYCHTILIAKKGHVLAHHFAHDGPTCNPANRTTELPILPFFHSFTLHLTPKLLDQLEAFKDGRRSATYWLHQEHLIRYNEFTQRHELTKLGQIPFGMLSVNLFSQVHDGRLADHHDQMDWWLHKAWKEGNPVAIAEAETDLLLYRAQWQRVLQSALYVVEIQTSSERFHKVGVTARPIEERILEIQAALMPHVGTTAVKVLGVFPHRGHVEPYVKFKYRDQRRAIGNFTEYFDFADLKATLRDLRRMPAKVLTSVEETVLAGMPSPIMQTMVRAQREQDIAAQRAAQRVHHREQTKAGMEAARQAGVHVGRPRGSYQANEILLAKPSSQAIIQCLNQGMSLRATAAAVGVAINTVRKVKAALEDD